jgi:hypothetical protein
MDFNEPTVIYTTSDLARAHAIENLLRGAGIRSFLVNESNVLPGLLPVESQIIVEAGHADEAARLIRQHEEHLHPED